MNVTVDFHLSTTPVFGRIQQKNETFAVLQRLNDEQALVLLPVMVLILCFMIFGITGNSLVCYIFSKKFKTTTQTTLFLSLSCFDLVTCCVGMPFEICDLRFFYMFDSAIACKIFRFIEAIPTLASNQVLLLIAIDRYRKVCHPLKRQISPLLARKLILFFVVVAVIFTLPALFIYGKRTAATHVPGITGYDCATSDDMKSSLYPVVYEGFLAFAFVCFVIVLVALYCCIWRASRRKAFTKTIMLTGMTHRLISTSSSGEGSSRRSGRAHRNGKGDPDSHILNLRINRTRTNKSTVIACAVTIVFFLSFVPHLALVIGKNVARDFDYNLNDSQLVAFNVFLRSFFVNAVANPVIYALMNVRFRFECAILMKRLFRHCSCSRRSVDITVPAHV